MMNVAECRSRIKELESRLKKLESDVKREKSITFWRKFCKLFQLDFNLSNIEFEHAVTKYKIGNYTITAYIYITDTYEYTGFAIFYDEYDGFKIYSDNGKIGMCYPTRLKSDDTFYVIRNYSTVTNLDNICRYITNYSKVLESTNYLPHITALRTFLLCNLKTNIFPKNITTIISTYFQK